MPPLLNSPFAPHVQETMVKRQLLVFVAFIPTFLTAAVCQAADTDQIRFYIGGRAGITFVPDNQFGEQMKIESTDDIFGAVVGLNLGKHLGVEITVDYHDSSLNVPGLGKIGEFAMWHIIPHLRVRYPLAKGKLTPSLLGGVGIGFGEFNDVTPRGERFSFGGERTSTTGSVGGGVEYFVANNIAVGVEARYLLFDLDVEVDGKRQKFDLDRALLYASFRLFFPEAKPTSSR